MANEVIEIDDDSLGLLVKSHKYGDKILIIDREDYVRASGFHWRLSVKGKYGAANIWCYSGGKKLETILLHRLILSFPKGLTVDHIDRNTLNNRKNNLRVVTKAQNSLNSKIFSTSTTGLKGVSRARNGKYRASIGIQNRTMHIGVYDTAEAAARAYQVAANTLSKVYSQRDL